MGIKPQVKISDAKTIIKALEIDCNNIVEINEGQIARTYMFESNSEEYYIQFNEKNMSQGTINEIIFLHDFKTNGIPLREMIGHGDYQNYRYIITRKAYGKAFERLSKVEFDDSIKNIMNLLYKISETNIDRFTGYGWLDEDGNGKFDSWQSHLLNVYEEEPGCFYGEWFNLFDQTFLEKEKFEYYFNKMKEQFSCLLDIRKLIHSGYCGGNILIDNGKVSAILDWQDAKYGDPIYDLAYMTFWMNKEYANRCMLEYANAFNLDRSKHDFYARLKCYKYYIGLDCMRYSAKTNNKEFYDYIMTILAEI